MTHPSSSFNGSRVIFYFLSFMAKFNKDNNFTIH